MVTIVRTVIRECVLGLEESERERESARRKLFLVSTCVFCSTIQKMKNGCFLNDKAPLRRKVFLGLFYVEPAFPLKKLSMLEM